MTITALKKTLRGYTAQARYYAQHMANDGADGFVQLGWIRLGPAIVKPVFRHADGTPVVLNDGRDHLTVLVCAVDPEAVVATEDEAWKVVL